MKRCALILLAFIACGCRRSRPGIIQHVPIPAAVYRLDDRIQPIITPLYLIKARRGHRDPVLDANPDGSPAPWGVIELATVPTSRMGGPTADLPFGAHRYPFWVDGPGQTAYKPPFRRYYTSTDPLTWHIGGTQPTVEFFLSIRVHDIATGAAELSFDKR